MSAEVSFTKRAAAELSRCFNGLSTSVARSQSTTSSNSSGSSGGTSGHGSGTSGSLSSATENIGIQGSNSRISSWKRKSSNPVINGTDSSLKSGSRAPINEEAQEGSKEETEATKKEPSKLEPSRIEQFKGLFNDKKSVTSDVTEKKATKRRNSSAATFFSGAKTSNSKNISDQGTNTSSFSFRKSSLSSGNSNKDGDNKINNVIRLFGHSKISTPASGGKVLAPNTNSISSVAIHPIDAKCGVKVTTSTPGTPLLGRTPSLHRAPAPPRKTSLARCKNFLIGLNKPRSVKELFHDSDFLTLLFRRYVGLRERSILAQVCAYWRDVLYNDTLFWRNVIFVINYNELRRLPLASLKSIPLESVSLSVSNVTLVDVIDTTVTDAKSNLSAHPDKENQLPDANLKGDNANNKLNQSSDSACIADATNLALECIKSNLYISIEMRGIDKVAFIGANDSDILNFISKAPSWMLKKISYLSLRSCSITDKGLEALLASVNVSLVELQFIGCNEITDSGSWASLVPNIQIISILDCINIADETVAAINISMVQLQQLNLQAYHVTDASIAFFAPTSSKIKNLTKIHLEHCWELSNQGMTALAYNLAGNNLTSLSIAGCSKVTDDAIEIIAEKFRTLQYLNLSWCTRISDASLEFIACDLSESIQHLVLDRCLHITDIGLGFISTMAKLETLSIRWCPQVRDFGLQTICSMRPLKSISIAGCHNLSINGLSCLVQMQHLNEIEVTNCPGATPELVKYLEDHLPMTTTIIA